MKRAKKARKLNLNKKRIRKLDAPTLNQAAGGGMPSFGPLCPQRQAREF